MQLKTRRWIPIITCLITARKGGYIIVSGDDRAVPVLGYCDRGEFDPENVPGGLQSLLYGYSQEIEFLRGSSLTAKASAPPVRR